jgi:ketosteroid isomerase-like protein
LREREAPVSTESENVATLKNAYAEWAGKKASDPSCWTSIMAEDVELRSLADGAPGVGFSQARHGLAEAKKYLEELTRDWEMISYEVEDYVAQGDCVVAIGSTTWRNEKTGKAVSTPKVDVWRMRNGKIVAFAEYFDTAKVLAAAWS